MSISIAPALINQKLEKKKGEEINEEEDKLSRNNIKLNESEMTSKFGTDPKENTG